MTNSELIELVEELNGLELQGLDFVFKFYPVFGPLVGVDCGFHVPEDATLEDFAHHFREVAKDCRTVANKLEEIINTRKEN